MNIKGWLTEIDRYGTEGVHKLFIGNKADLVERKVVQFEAAKVCCDIIRLRDRSKHNLEGICGPTVNTNP